jgi:hypothetical protein
MEAGCTTIDVKNRQTKSAGKNNHKKQEIRMQVLTCINRFNEIQ